MPPHDAEEILVRPVRPEEYAAAGEATARAYEEYAPEDHGPWLEYRRRIADIAGRAGRATVLVALDRGVVAGSATLEVDQRMREDSERPLAADEAHLRMVGVDPGHRRRGIARRLVLACMELARASGKRRLTLDTGPEMSAARALYESLGFHLSGTRDLGSGWCLYSYELTLPAPARVSSPP
jgi:ribosomal protein S18 acetylase RimI-like enzyme